MVTSTMASSPAGLVPSCILNRWPAIFCEIPTNWSRPDGVVRVLIMSGKGDWEDVLLLDGLIWA